MWKEKAQLLQSVPGVGKNTAHALIAQLPELGEANRQEIAKLVGVAPLNQDSGQRRGRRTTWGARASVAPRSTWPRWWPRATTNGWEALSSLARKRQS